MNELGHLRAIWLSAKDAWRFDDDNFPRVPNPDEILLHVQTEFRHAGIDLSVFEPIIPAGANWLKIVVIDWLENPNLRRQAWSKYHEYLENAEDCMRQADLKSKAKQKSGKGAWLGPAMICLKNNPNLKDSEIAISKLLWQVKNKLH